MVKTQVRRNVLLKYYIHDLDNMSNTCFANRSALKECRKPVPYLFYYSVVDGRILRKVKTNLFVTVQQIKNSVQDVGVDVSKTTIHRATIKRRLHQHNLRGFIASLNNRMTKVQKKNL